MVVCVKYLGKTSKVTALVATMARTQNKKAAKVLTVILSSLKIPHPTYCAHLKQEPTVHYHSHRFQVAAVACQNIRGFSIFPPNSHPNLIKGPRRSPRAPRNESYLLATFICFVNLSSCELNGTTDHEKAASHSSREGCESRWQRSRNSHSSEPRETPLRRSYSFSQPAYSRFFSA